MGLGEGRTDDVHPVVRRDLAIPVWIDWSGGELGVLLEEALHACRCEHHQDGCIFTAQVLKAVGGTSWDKHERSLGSLQQLPVREESEMPFEDVPHLVFPSVHVLRGSVLWTYRYLQEGKGASRGCGPRLDGGRTSRRASDRLAAVSSDHECTCRRCQGNSSPAAREDRGYAGGVYEARQY